MPPTRRELLAGLGAAGAAWVLKDALAVQDALAYARSAVQQQPPPRFTALTAEEAAVLEAAADRIIPPDDLPGAKAAGVIHFLDRAFSTFAKNDLNNAQQLIVDLNRRARRRQRGVASFAALAVADQDAILTQIEKSDRFQGLRYLTIVGMFANPSWGGNRDMAGWKLIDFMPHGAFQPPFGYYDAEAARERR
jgi:gluconate 2-dehydrogenase gamma chain